MSKLQNMIDNGQGKVVPRNSVASVQAKLDRILMNSQDNEVENMKNEEKIDYSEFRKLTTDYDPEVIKAQAKEINEKAINKSS